MKFRKTPALVECSFLIPIRRDRNLSDGTLHSPTEWQWLDSELERRFGGGTKSPGLYSGFYTDLETGEHVSDDSRQFLLAVSRKNVQSVRELLKTACVEFHQKCIYLSIAGKVEFIEHP